MYKMYILCFSILHHEYQVISTIQMILSYHLFVFVQLTPLPLLISKYITKRQKPLSYSYASIKKEIITEFGLVPLIVICLYQVKNIIILEKFCFLRVS